jgi:hypothetical protein
VGDLLALWSYVASEGSQADEGLGVQRDGKPLNLTIMATALEFPGVDELRTFLDYLAEIEHIDPDYWRDRGIVYLAAMNRRMEAYRKSKGRVSTGRPVGRPRKSGNSGKHPDG